MNTHAVIRGLGMYVPPRIMTNQELETLVDTTDEWITSRTGIKQRHVVDKGVTTSDISAEAARNALADAGIDASQLTHIFVATLTPDRYCGATAPMVQQKIGANHCMAADLNAACSGFVYSLQVARGITMVEPDAVVLVIGAEVLSSRTNYEDRTTCVIFGDGAGAAIVTAETTLPDKPLLARIRDMKLSSDGALADLLTVTGGGAARPYALGEAVQEDFFIQMQGREVYRHAVRNLDAVSREILERNGFTVDDVDAFVPHQANLRIIEAVAKKLALPEKKVFVNIHKYGNTSAASVPIALTEARDEGVLSPGTRTLVSTFGGGFTWGAAILEF